MNLSTLVRQAAKRRLVFKQVVRAIGTARPFADEEDQAALLAQERDETHRFLAEKQADQAAQYAGLKTRFRAAQQAFTAGTTPFEEELHAAAGRVRTASRARIRAYRAAAREGRAALDQGVADATALYDEFAPYLRNRRWLRSYAARMPLFERIVWVLLHTLALLAVMLKLAQTPSWAGFLQDDVLLFWGGLWLVSAIRWGTLWGLARLLRRRDKVRFEAVRNTYKAHDLARKQDALVRCLPPLALDLSVLTAPAPPDEANDQAGAEEDAEEE